MLIFGQTVSIDLLGKRSDPTCTDFISFGTTAKAQQEATNTNSPEFTISSGVAPTGQLNDLRTVPSFWVWVCFDEAGVDPQQSLMVPAALQALPQPIDSGMIGLPEKGLPASSVQLCWIWPGICCYFWRCRLNITVFRKVFRSLLSQMKS